MAVGKLIINATAEGYGTDQVSATMTVGELMDFLDQYNEDTPVYLAFDNHYTYGSIHEADIEEED